MKNDNEFAFRFNTFVYREGCDHNIVTDENVFALWKFLVGESQEVSKVQRNQPWTDAKKGDGKGQEKQEKVGNKRRSKG